MNVRELKKEQLQELKMHYYDEILRDTEDRSISYDEMVNIDEIVSDERIFNEYSGYMFSDDDFSPVINEQPLFVINDEIMEGDPLRLETELKLELIKQLQEMNGSNFEDTCENMRRLADVFEEIEEHINDEKITFKYNQFGTWYRVEESEEE